MKNQGSSEPATSPTRRFRSDNEGRSLSNGAVSAVFNIEVSVSVYQRTTQNRTGICCSSWANSKLSLITHANPQYLLCSNRKRKMPATCGTQPRALTTDQTFFFLRHIPGSSDSHTHARTPPNRKMVPALDISHNECHRRYRKRWRGASGR